MPCTPFKGKSPNGSEIRGFFCTRGHMTKPCALCGAHSCKLCDGVLASGKTCDLPLCAECAVHVEPDRDYCPRHKPVAIAQKDP